MPSSPISSTATNDPWADPAGFLLDQFEVRPSERAVVSLFATNGTITHASMLYGPPKMGMVSWDEWSKEAHYEPREWDLPAQFCDTQGRMTIARASLTQAQASRWLNGALTGAAPAIGTLPLLDVDPQLGEARRIAITGRNFGMPSDGYVLGLDRPATGFHVPLQGEADKPPILWAETTRPTMTLVGLDLKCDKDFPRTRPHATPGLFIGRVSRQAWFGRLLYRPESGLQIEIFREPGGDIQFHHLELEVSEGDRDEIYDLRRVALADLGIPARAAARIGINWPTLGRGIQRGMRLWRRGGELLDQQEPLNLVESVHMTFSTNGGASSTSVIGDTSPMPQLARRLQQIAEVDTAWVDWAEKQGRDIRSPERLRRQVRDAMRSARGSIVIIDPYFAEQPSDWDILSGVNVPVQILAGQAARLPTNGAMPDVDIKRWIPAQHDKIPYHDRFVLIDDRDGLHMGTSISGLQGRRAYRISHLSPQEVAAWSAAFREWWQAPETRPALL